MFVKASEAFDDKGKLKRGYRELTTSKGSKRYFLVKTPVTNPGSKVKKVKKKVKTCDSERLILHKDKTGATKLGKECLKEIKKKSVKKPATKIVKRPKNKTVIE